MALYTNASHNYLLVTTTNKKKKTMGLSAIVAVFTGVVGQVALCFWYRPARNRIRQLINCLRHPRPPPSRPVTADTIFNAIKDIRN